MNSSFDVIIVGAGAAGLICSSSAGKFGRKVLLLEHSERVGKKILISGGGRCNFTNLTIAPDNFISANPFFCKSALSRYSQNDFIELVEKYNIPYHEKEFGQLFCDNKSSDIVNMLLKECIDSGVEIRTSCTIDKINKQNKFTLHTNAGIFEAESLVIATGGLSIPKMGATDFGLKAADQFGINIIPCRPGLVPLLLNEKMIRKLGDLAGISADSVVSCGKRSFRGSILFTHKGLSGPAVLQISNYWNDGQEISINFLPEADLKEQIRKWKVEKPKAELKNLLSALLTKRLSHRLLLMNHGDKPVNQYNEKEISEIADTFHQWKVIPSGTDGFEKAEVTLGGIDTRELSSKTFECKKVKGLFFIGEVVDVTGWLGGYNFQWAWSSGFCAGQYV
ncbi:MAG: aminoacetone oxidase family FAD-binding enzyme [Ignavibacteriae bacterium HGW-Ignavibacteriae-3]|nr:MAG: aminoacetone oxidase family FAD-binding enzyme [Ignavibacteriae bacterium HGW-Ignavibacteriae-3]